MYTYTSMQYIKCAMTKTIKPFCSVRQNAERRHFNARSSTDRPEYGTFYLMICGINP